MCLLTKRQIEYIFTSRIANSNVNHRAELVLVNLFGASKERKSFIQLSRMEMQ